MITARLPTVLLLRSPTRNKSHLRQTHTVLPMLRTEKAYALGRTSFQAAWIGVNHGAVRKMCAYRA